MFKLKKEPLGATEATVPFVTSTEGEAQVFEFDTSNSTQGFPLHQMRMLKDLSGM